MCVSLGGKEKLLNPQKWNLKIIVNLLEKYIVMNKLQNIILDITLI